ncbi:unnamed protein product [Chironomus riparius]|uniref:LITAF domain-containing protein n=1 Tax=Chironomus riparius TaxID=315576 RepID=A0A9N9RW19_9DIPT|nr:unnamed protein product [Chironomus riparius]
MSKLLQNMPLPSTPQFLPPLPKTLPPIHQNQSAFANPMPPLNNSIGMLPVSTIIMVDTKLKRYPIVMNCPFCKEVIKTSVKKVHPCWDFFCCCFCFGMRCKKRHHLCSKCKNYLGTYDGFL